MEGFFVFDVSNDLVFKFCNEKMSNRLYDIAKKTGLVDAGDNLSTGVLIKDVIIQIFNPLLANLRFMLIQFDNSFNYVKCKHDFNMVFDDESFGFLLITICSEKTIEFMQRMQGVYKVRSFLFKININFLNFNFFQSFLNHLCGPAIYQLKCDTAKSDILTKLITTWNRLYLEDQSTCLEALEQLSVSNELKKTNLVACLEQALEKLKNDAKFQRSHAILFHGNKFLSMFSARTSQSLTPSDIFFLNILCQSVDVTSSKIDTFLIFMKGFNNSCIPYRAHRIMISEKILFVLLSESGNTIISSNFYETFILLNKIKVLQAQIDLDSLVVETERLDRCIKNIIEIERKTKTKQSPEMEECVKNFQNKYETLRKKYIDMLKIMDKSQLVKVESYFPCFMEATKELYRLTYFSENARTITRDQEKAILNVNAFISDKVMKLSEFLDIKATNNFSAISLLEEFAGLVHFIYIDRTRGVCIFPDINRTARETTPTFKKKVWEMIETSRSYLQSGQTMVIWKDFAFTYLYTLWFEDSNGQLLKPKDQLNALSTKQNLVPGIISCEYYK
jgi:Hermansky-Pudlak syndrome 1 protein